MSLSYIFIDSTFWPWSPVCLIHWSSVFLILEKGLRVLGLIGQVLEFPRIGFQVVQLLGRLAGSKEKALLKIIELAFLSPVADRKVSRFVVLVGAGLQMRALGITIADILEALSTDRSNAVIGLVAAVPGATANLRA